MELHKEKGKYFLYHNGRKRDLDRDQAVSLIKKIDPVASKLIIDTMSALSMPVPLFMVKLVGEKILLAYEVAQPIPISTEVLRTYAAAIDADSSVRDVSVIFCKQCEKTFVKVNMKKKKAQVVEITDSITKRFHLDTENAIHLSGGKCNHRHLQGGKA